MVFEWDEEKNATNRRTHGLSFETAALVFLDSERIERFDREHSETEERWQTIGKADGCLFVVYTERGDVTRIISARQADARERRMYHGLRTEDWHKANT